MRFIGRKRSITKSRKARQSRSRLGRGNVYERTKIFLEMDTYERSVLFNSLNDMKTNLQRQGKATDTIDELLVKVVKAPIKKFRVLENK